MQKKCVTMLDHGISERELVAHTSSGPANKPFGWEHNQEREQVRADLIAQGMDPESREFYWEVVREHDRRKAQKLTMRQRQDLARWLGLKWVTPHPSDVKTPPRFTDEELAAIIERFAMANDELGQSIAAKAKAMRPTPTAQEDT